MKKLLLTIGILIMMGLSLYSQDEQVIYIGQGATEMVTNVNSKFQDHTDSIGAVQDTINQLQDTTAVLRTDINADYFKIAGNALNSGIVSPALAQDGLAIVWDNVNNEYKLATVSGSGTAISVGTAQQVPYVNTAGDDFLYSSSLTFDGTNLDVSGSLISNALQVGTNAFLSEAEMEILDGATLTTTELNYVDGVTSNIQTQINSLAGGHDAVTLSTPSYNLSLTGQLITVGQVDLTTDVTGVLPDANVANDITITNISQVQDLTATATELNYTDGVTSAIQTQLDAKEGTVVWDDFLTETTGNVDVDTSEATGLSGVYMRLADTTQLVWGDGLNSSLIAGVETITWDSTDIYSVLDDKMGVTITANDEIGTTYTLALADGGGMVTLTNASPVTVTVPPNSTTAFPIGTQILLVQEGAGLVTVSAGAGVTINSSGSALSLGGQYSSGTLIKRATDTWLLIGDLQ